MFKALNSRSLKGDSKKVNNKSYELSIYSSFSIILESNEFDKSGFPKHLNIFFKILIGFSLSGINILSNALINLFFIVELLLRDEFINLLKIGLFIKTKFRP